MVLPKLVIFDLDGTLAVSKMPMTQEMGHMLTQLLLQTRVAIISGGRYLQFEKQVFPALPDTAQKERLFIFPTSGASYYQYQNGWNPVYAHRLSQEQITLIKHALQTAQKEAGIITEEPFW